MPKRRDVRYRVESTCDPRDKDERHFFTVFGVDVGGKNDWVRDLDPVSKFSQGVS